MSEETSVSRWQRLLKGAKKGTESSSVFSRWQKVVLGCPIVLMIAVCVAGGWGTYHNISSVYGADTAVGVLAAGEGATAVLALLMLGLTVLGQGVPLLLRAGLWVLPLVAAGMSATAATSTGELVVYAATPMAITAGAEGLAFLVRRMVIHQAGMDVDAQTRSADVLRALAYQQARARSHPWARARKVSELRAWRLARKVGRGDVALGADLLDVQRARISAGADTALMALYAPAEDTPETSATELETSAEDTPALPPVSAPGTEVEREQAPDVRADTAGYPGNPPADQAGQPETVRPPLEAVRPDTPERVSLRADVRRMVAGGVEDVRDVVDAIATRHGRAADDPKLRQTVGKYIREARADVAEPEPEPASVGQYL